MSSHSLALPPGVDPMQRWRSTAQAHESFVSTAAMPTTVRPLVRESWLRSLAHRVDPEVPGAPVAMAEDEIIDARRTHPLNGVVQLVQRILVDHASDAGVIVAMADADARLLWVEGDASLLRQAESINVVRGSIWSESAAGTNAIGTALAVEDLVQIFGSEHFTKIVHPWSCTAAPIHDPLSGDICGFLNITGRHDVASPQSALLIRSAVAAVEAELRLRRSSHGTPVAYLRTLGRERGELTLGGTTSQLSLRHTELLLLLSMNPDGLTAGELAWKMYEHDAAEVTVRAEMSRLRKAYPFLLAPTRPYRLRVTLQTDAAKVTDCLQRGAHRQAIELYRGPVLPRSEAPGVVEYRNHLHGWLRLALLQHAGVDVLMRYARSAARHDLELWQACLDRLPYGSPHRAEVSAAVKSLHDAYAAARPARNVLATSRDVTSSNDRVSRWRTTNHRASGQSDGASDSWRVE